MIPAPVLRPLPKRHYCLHEDLRLVGEIDGHKLDSFTIPRDFEWNGSSIPRPVWSLIGAAPGYFLRASCVHDWFYQSGAIPRKAADNLFYEMIREDGARRLQAWLMRRAVGMMGGFYYNPPKPKK